MSEEGIRFNPNKLRKLKWYDEIYIFIRWRIIDPIVQFPTEVKYFFQRGIRGWCDRDIWGFDYFLSGLILNGLVEIKKDKSGIPATIDPATGKRDYSEERWDSILDRMISGFAVLRKCQIGEELEYGGWCESEEDKKRLNDVFKNHCRFTTKEEEKQIEEAFNLFRDHFWCLWT